MKKKFFVVFLVTTMLLFMAGCGSNQIQALDRVNVEKHEEVRTLGEQDQITVTLSYPVLSAESKNKIVTKLNEQFQQDADAFVQQIETDYLSNIKGTAEFQYLAEEKYNQQGMLSILLNENFADGSNRQYAATYSLANGEKMTLDEVLNMGEKEAENLIIQQFGGVIQTDPNTFHTDALEYVEQNLSQMQYYRNAGGLSVFFQAGEIAPESNGILEIIIQ